MLMHPYYKIRTLADRASSNVPWRIAHLCLSYGFPSNLTGGKIGIVSLGGGYLHSDIEQYFAHGNDGYPLPIPNLTDVSVDAGVGNSPGSDADVENLLDIMAAGTSYSMSTGVAANISVYFANNDVGGIGRAVTKAAADGCNTCSISWGADEAMWGLAPALAMERTAIQATAGGMVIFAASGDNDSSDGGPQPANVDLPASCPHIIGCGGTRRPHNASSASPETVWNNNPGNADGQGTGGGFSSIFPRPTWQVPVDPISPAKRMVPDVAANADPVTGVHIIYQGQDIVVGGTSFVAPFYSGLFCALGAKGFVTPTLWANPKCFNDITIGDNGMYQAGVGPDPCTGLGSPKPLMLARLFP